MTAAVPDAAPTERTLMSMPESTAELTDFRQRKSAQTLEHSEGERSAQAIYGLVHLGFRERDARHAVREVESRHAAAPASVVTLVREALSLLT